MQLAKSVSELNEKSWYRQLKFAFVVLFVTAQAIGFFLVRSRTHGEVIAPISYKLIGRFLKEDLPAYGRMSDEEAGRQVHREDTALWREYVEKYENTYYIDPVAKRPEYSRIQRAHFHGVAFLLITAFFETFRRAFYYVVFGKVFPRKRRRKKKGSESAEMPENQ